MKPAFHQQRCGLCLHVQFHSVHIAAPCNHLKDFTDFQLLGPMGPMVPIGMSPTAPRLLAMYLKEGMLQGFAHCGPCVAVVAHHAGHQIHRFLASQWGAGAVGPREMEIPGMFISWGVETFQHRFMMFNVSFHKLFETTNQRTQCNKSGNHVL